MNDTPNPASPASRPDSPDVVQVVLGECSAADADTVFTVLRDHFPSDRGDDAPSQTGSSDPAVWTGAFRASRTPEPGAGVLLAGSVTADLQGGPVAVERLRAALDSAFAVTAKGTVSGDQEIQVQLRLTGAEHGEARERA
ncbi:hypothetical protein [Streptomyces alboniger]|uniref:hypothetical protein n=1 Tax=Streptomyces alboniger TaxID=132473 RepID=UPI0008775D87|nr:hypothetical protein [Streptomyces alboniger]